MRDDFSAKDKQTLGQRVGFICSNPDCRAQTAGPQEVGHGGINVGVAAHITAAALGGPRFDDSLTQDQRRNLSNAVWLCQTCGKRADSDPRFTTKLLRAWKTIAEDRASTALGRSAAPTTETREQTLRRTIQPWEGKRVTLARLNTGKAAAISGPIKGEAEVTVVACSNFFVTIGLMDGSQRSISLDNVSINYDERRSRLQIQERYE